MVRLRLRGSSSSSATGNVRAVGVEQHRADRALATVAGAEDDRALAVTRQRSALLFEQLAGDVAGAAHADERDDAGADRPR